MIEYQCIINYDMVTNRPPRCPYRVHILMRPYRPQPSPAPPVGAD